MKQKLRQIFGILLIISLIFMAAHFFLHSTWNEEDGHCSFCQILQNGSLTILLFQLTVSFSYIPVAAVAPLFFLGQPLFQRFFRGPPLACASSSSTNVF